MLNRKLKILRELLQESIDKIDASSETTFQQL